MYPGAELLPSRPRAQSPDPCERAARMYLDDPFDIPLNPRLRRRSIVVYLTAASTGKRKFCPPWGQEGGAHYTVIGWICPTTTGTM